MLTERADGHPVKERGLGTRSHSWREVVHAYLVLPHAVPIIAVMSATAAFALIARGGWPGTADMAALLLAMLGGQVSIGAVNELVDVELDRASKPSKPIAAGLVTEDGARLMAFCGILVMIAGSLRFSFAAFALCALGTGLGVAYSFWFKRTMWSWVPYVLAVPLIPIWVWSALEEVPLALLAVYPIAIPALVAVQIAQSVPDIEADQSVRVRTLAVALGERRAMVVCWGSVVLSVVLATVLAPQAAERPVWGWVASGVAITLVGFNAALWRRDPHRGRMSCFPLVAAAVAILGVGWALGATG